MLKKRLCVNRRFVPKDIWRLRYLLWAVLKRLLKPRVFINACLGGCATLIKSSRVKHMPFFIMIEASSRCNISCPMCEKSLFTFNRDTEDMSFELFKRIIDELRHYLIFVALWNYGEPLLNSELEQMVAYCSRFGIVTVISTNGLLLTSDRARRLTQAGLHYMIISVDGVTDTVYQTYRKGCSLSILVRNIQDAVAGKQRMKKRLPVIELQYIVMKDNEHQIDDFFSLAQRWGVDRATLKRFNTLLLCTIRDHFLPSNSAFVFEPLGKKPAKHGYRCKTPWRSLVINANGAIVPCCCDYFSILNMGNVRDCSVRDVWFGSTYALFRSQVQQRCLQNTPCVHCSHLHGQEGSFIEVRHFTE